MWGVFKFASTRTTSCPKLVSAQAKLIAVVVFPVPPFPEAIPIQRTIPKPPLKISSSSDSQFSHVCKMIFCLFVEFSNIINIHFHLFSLNDKRHRNMPPKLSCPGKLSAVHLPKKEIKVNNLVQVRIVDMLSDDTAFHAGLVRNFIDFLVLLKLLQQGVESVINGIHEAFNNTFENITRSCILQTNINQVVNTLQFFECIIECFFHILLQCYRS